MKWHLYQSRQYWRNCGPCHGTSRTAFDLPAAEEQIARLLKVTTAADFWSRQDAQDLTRELAQFQEKKEFAGAVQAKLQDMETLAELLEEEQDQELLDEFYREAEQFRGEMEARQLVLLMSGEYDAGNAILSIHPGAGGLDSQDWAEMLLRMYLRWCEQSSFSARLLEVQPGEEAGIKSATVLVKGNHAYGYMQAEIGVHRLVRISPFDAAKRRHTSFASVDVSPEVPETIDVEIRPEDLRVDTYRSSGAGGQHVNMTDSAVRITHLPTGIVVSCQDERSQHMNRQMAMNVLRAKLYDREMEQRKKELDSLVGEKKEIGWSSQIRSYVLHPYTMVKDHRTGEEMGNVQAVLDGALDRFIFAYLRWKNQS